MKRFAIVLLLSIVYSARAQTGAPVYLQNFGQGDGSLLLPGPPLAAGLTGFTYSDQLCPPPGSYCLARRTKVGSCFNNEWIDVRRDDDYDMEYGNMMIVNSNATLVRRIVYADTVATPLCPGTTYRLTFATINLDHVQEACPNATDLNVFHMSIMDRAGNVIKEASTPPIDYGPPTEPQKGYRLSRYSMDFVAPPGVTKIQLKIEQEPTYSRCGDDFAFDRVIIQSVGPDATIYFPGLPSTIFMQSFCYEANASLTIDASVGSYYGDTRYQWQQSLDSGRSWTDIPGATSLSYTRNYSSPDSFMYRISAGEPYNMANPFCRVVSNTLQVNIDGPPTFKAISNSPVCSGSPLKFEASGAASYEWSGPNGFYDNVPKTQIYFSSLRDSGMYYVKAVSLGGCSGVDSLRVRIIGVDVDAGPDTVVCKEEPVQLSVSSGARYEWSPATGLNNRYARQPIARPETTTQYTVTVTSADGCQDTAQVKVQVRNAVTLKASMDVVPHLCVSYDSLVFTDKSSGVVQKRSWEFGNGRTDTLANPNTQYYNTYPGEPDILARLIVKDTAGCVDTVVQKLTVHENCLIAVPTGFTPNNDGRNDLLGPTNAFKASDLVFTVYNKFGQKIFETRDYTRRWDGKLNGREQATGVYVWILGYSDRNGKRVFQKGTVLLIR